MKRPAQETRVLVVEDHTLFAEALALSLRANGYAVERFALPARGVASACVATALRVGARVAFVDLDLGPHGSGHELVEPLARAGVAVVVVTASPERAEWGACLHEGASAVVWKARPLDVLVDSVRRIDAGLPAMPPQEHQALLAAWRGELAEIAEERIRLGRLTQRERQILSELADGYRVRDIASRDVVSTETVRTQVKSILQKLGVSSQLAAVGFVHRSHRHDPSPDVADT